MDALFLPCKSSFQITVMVLEYAFIWCVTGALADWSRALQGSLHNTAEGRAGPRHLLHVLRGLP